MVAIAIIGAGPRGISITERIAAYLKQAETHDPLTLHVIDAVEVGAGRVWDTSQTHTLCMNTLAGAVTLFTEPGATVSAPVLEGPTMYEWIQLLRGDGNSDSDGVSEPKQALFNAHLPAPLDQFVAEMRTTRPESNPSRALYGEYLRWVWEVARAQLPASISIIEHHAQAVTMKKGPTTDLIELSDGTCIHAHATVIASGWVLPKLTRAQQEFATSGLTYIAPNNPVEQDVSRISPGERVVVRGLGMGFFDLMALTTLERGGRFVPDTSSRSGLRYEAAGAEPVFFVTSGRGYPYLPKSEYHSLPPKADLTHLQQAIAAHHAADGSGACSFGTDLWPALVRDAYTEYYRTLARVRPAALLAPLAELLAAIDTADLAAHASPDDIVPVSAALTQRLKHMTTEPFVMEHFIDPLNHTDTLPLTALNQQVTQSMTRDIAQAVAARNAPVKAGLWAISAGRKPVAIATENGRGRREASLRQYMAFGQMVGSGPPLFRTRELLALADAGYVTFLGPDPTINIERDFHGAATAFRATSHSRSVTATTLVDVFLPSPDITRPADELTRCLVQTGRIRPFCADGVQTSSPETDAATRRTVHPDGTLDPRLHIVGIPTGRQWADTTISPMPGTNPRMLQETDVTARSLLTQAGIL